MGIAAAVIASLAKNSHRNNVVSCFIENKTSYQTNKVFIDGSWLKKRSSLILPHVNETLLKEICSRINNISEKSLNEPELKKIYLTLIQSLSLYQSKAEAILLEKDNMKSEIVFFTSVFILPALILICISIFISMYPITLLTFLFFTGFIGKTLYSINKLRRKHPANETELHYHFKNFINTLEKYRNDKTDGLNPHCVSFQSSEMPIAHVHTKSNSHVANLKSNTLLFKSTEENDANPTVKPIKGDNDAFKLQPLL